MVKEHRSTDITTNQVAFAVFHFAANDLFGGRSRRGGGLKEFGSLFHPRFVFAEADQRRPNLLSEFVCRIDGSEKKMEGENADLDSILIVSLFIVGVDTTQAKRVKLL